MNTASTTFRLLVMICVLVMIMLSLLSFILISPRRTIHTTPINLNAPALSPTDPLYLAACVPISKDLTPLPEFFLHHYAHIGINRFYIVDQSPEGNIRNNYSKLPLDSTHI